MSGTAWVTFETVHPSVSNSIRTYVTTRSVRDELKQHDDGAFTWTRPPNGDGSGVKKNSQEFDFYRMVASAVLNFTVSTVERERNWPIDYRQIGRQLVDIIDSGWDETKEDTST